MLRRLYFLFPDESHAQRVVDQLSNMNIPGRRMHAIARGIELKTLPQATERQKNDTAFFIESFLWRANLAVFAVGLVAFIAALASTAFFWSLLSLSVMLATFFAGKEFVMHVPNIHLTEFTDALSHGEILLMIDVPIYRVAEIENFVHHHYPEAELGGTSWTIDALGI